MTPIKDFAVSSAADGFDEFLMLLSKILKFEHDPLSGAFKYYGYLSNKPYCSDKLWTDNILTPSEALALLQSGQPKQLTVEDLKELLIVGAKIKVGKQYAEKHFSKKEGSILELVNGVFEHDNGLYTTDVNCPSIWNEQEEDFDSIYHLFGNDLENFMDCEILHSSQPEIETVQEEVKGEDEMNAVIKKRYPFYDPNIAQKDIEIDSEAVKYLMGEYTAHLQQQLKQAKEKISKAIDYIDSIGEFDYDAGQTIMDIQSILTKNS